MTIESTQAKPAVPTDPTPDMMSNIRRGAQQLLADVSHQPLTFRIRASDVVVELEWTGRYGTEDAEWKPALSATPAAGEAAPTMVTADGIEGILDICAPTVGTFYRAPEPGAAPFVAEGDRIRRGQQIGILEAMKLMIPLESEHDGELVAVLVEDGTPVEYGDKLFAFVPVATH